jgi:hypothetical protein
VIAALDVIALAFEGQPSPEVFARVLRGNEGSHAIFDRLQALRLPPLRRGVIVRGELQLAVEDQELRIWHANKPLEWRFDPGVYVPPEKPAEPFLTPMDHANPLALSRCGATRSASAAQVASGSGAANMGLLGHARPRKSERPGSSLRKATRPSIS